MNFLFLKFRSTKISEILDMANPWTAFCYPGYYEIIIANYAADSKDYWFYKQVDIDYLFFQLLQVAIGNRNVLSSVPTEKQWTELFVLSKKHALVAVAFLGMKDLYDSSLMGMNVDGLSSSGVMDKKVYQKWLGLTGKIAQRNKMLNEACGELVKQYAHDGMLCCILKGQGNLVYYPEGLQDCRTPGDIDVWCKTADSLGIDIAVGDIDGKGAHYEKIYGKQGVIEYVKMLWRLRRDNDNNGDRNKNEVRYHHVGAPNINGIDVEVHFRPLYQSCPLRNRRLQSWFKDNEQFGMHDARVGDCVLPTPTVSFNAVYQLCHIYTHLFDEGIGLRQLLDYYFVLRALHIEQCSLAGRTHSMVQWAEGRGIAVKSNEEIMRTLSRFGMRKFAGAVMWVLARVFEPNDNDDDSDNLCLTDWQKRWPWMICKPNEKEGKFLLSEIMQAGNFGKFDDRIKHGGTQFTHAIEKTKHNLRLLTHYPEEVLWEPFFRVYHWIWRKCELWRY